MPQEKQFEPTRSRVERAKREGDLARSQEIGNIAAFAASLIAVTAVVMPLASAARAVLLAAVRGQSGAPEIAVMLVLMLVPAASAACAAVFAGVVQSGGLRLIPVAIRFDRLAPGANLKRMLSKESLVTATRGTVAFVCAGAALIPAFWGIYAAVMRAADVRSIAAAAWNGGFHTSLVACAAGGIFACADYGIQFVRWRERLRMSLEEIKRDHKEHEGDPLARSRRRAMHRQIARGSLRKVKDAAFVLSNPTHLAIALEYRPPAVPVPRVLVRAADETAIRVRALASQYRIPIVENVPLARALYESARPGDYIPHETYVAVAEVVAALTRGGVLGRTP